MTRPVLALATALGLAPSLSAQAITFIPTSGTHAWNSGSNWVGGSFPNATGDRAQFPVPTGDRNVQLNVPITVESLSGSGSGATTTNISAGTGGSLTFSGTQGAATFGWSTNGTTISAPIILASGLGVNNTGQGARFSGVVSGTGRINVGGTNGPVLVLSGSNTYFGNTIVSFGGTIVALNASALGSTATGTVVESGGTLEVHATLPAGETITVSGEGSRFGGVQEFALGSSGTGTVNGPVLLAANATIGTKLATVGNDRFTVNGTISGTGTGVRNLTVTGESRTFLNGPIDGTVNNLVVDGTGVVRLAAANTYAGTTTVNAGRLIAANAAGSATSNGEVLVNAGGTLGGNGAVTGPVIVFGGLEPGDVDGSNPYPSAVGRLRLGGLTMPSGRYTWQLAALSTANPGTDFDQVRLTAGSLALGGTSKLTLDFSLLNGTGPNSGDAFWAQPRSWTVIDLTGGAINSGQSDFATITNPTFASGTFDTAVLANGDIVLRFTPVPEPAGVLALCGVAALAGWRSRKRAGEFLAGFPAGRRTLGRPRSGPSWSGPTARSWTPTSPTPSPGPGRCRTDRRRRPAAAG